MSGQDDIRDATAVVVSFVIAMNDWETRRYYRSRVDHGYRFTAERDARLAGPLSASELDEEYGVHFRAHCTDRKRVYGGFPSSCGKPPTYHGVSADSAIEATQPKPGGSRSSVPGDHCRNGSSSLSCSKRPTAGS